MANRSLSEDEYISEVFKNLTSEGYFRPNVDPVTIKEKVLVSYGNYHANAGYGSDFWGVSIANDGRILAIVDQTGRSVELTEGERDLFMKFADWDIYKGFLSNWDSIEKTFGSREEDISAG
eukprot:4896169-Amphidinium_carterae.1